LGIDISAGQISALLLDGQEAFHAEKDALLPMARQISGYLHCDDTSARHRGHNAVCTHIGNELFASFHSTDSKSRLNFLQLLCLPEERYTWCEEAGVGARFELERPSVLGNATGSVGDRARGPSDGGFGSGPLRHLADGIVVRRVGAD
jgi:hypothetical protein